MSPVILWFIGLAPILRVRSGFEPVGTTAVVLGSRRCSRGDSSGPTTTERVSAGWDARFVRPRRCSGIVQVPSRGNQGIPLATISSAILFRQAGLHCFQRDISCHLDDTRVRCAFFFPRGWSGLDGYRPMASVSFADLFEIYIAIFFLILYFLDLVIPFSF